MCLEDQQGDNTRLTHSLDNNTVIKKESNQGPLEDQQDVGDMNGKCDKPAAKRITILGIWKNSRINMM